MMLPASFNPSRLCAARLLPLLTGLLLSSGSFGQASYSCPGCDLRGHNFSGQDLTNANFTHAQLDQASFQGANLSGARFDHASLKMANFNNAICGVSASGPTSFLNADLTMAWFTETKFEQTRMEYARLTHTYFTSVDLRQCAFGLSIEIDGENGGGKPLFTDARLNCEMAWARPWILTEKTAFSGCGLQWNNQEGKIKDGLWTYGPDGADAVPARKTEVTSAQVKNPVYVSTTGTNASGCGSSSSPCQTIDYALTQGSASHPDGFHLLLEYGKYEITDGALVLPAHVSITGGYWNGNPTNYQSILNFCIPGSNSSLIKITGPGSVSLSYLAISGCRTTTGFGATPQAMIELNNADSVSLDHVGVTVVARGTGETGAAAPPMGPAASAKAPGSDSNTDTLGGVGGKTPAAFNSSGGDGANAFIATGRCAPDLRDGCCGWPHPPPTPGPMAGGGMPGTSGQGSIFIASNGQYGASSWHGGLWHPHPFKTNPTNGMDGADGGNSVVSGDGGAPSNDTLGTFSGGAQYGWTPGRGGSGTGGGTGGGGGGGGAGGYMITCVQNQCDNPTKINGGAGGGGGAGGYGAIGGTGGVMGPPALGIVLLNSTLTVGEKVTLTGGAGGHGGTGGAGGASGPPGSGSAGQQPAGAGNGGHGGNGGWGAPGGGGAGGNGGPSINVLQDQASSISGTLTHYLGSSGPVGAGGAGGTPQPGQGSNAGQSGKGGEVLESYTIP